MIRFDEHYQKRTAPEIAYISFSADQREHSVLEDSALLLALNANGEVLPLSPVFYSVGALSDRLDARQCFLVRCIDERDSYMTFQTQSMASAAGAGLQW